MAEFCNDYGDNPACQGTIDPQYTMDYTDVEPGCFVHWCAVCGPLAHRLLGAVNEAFDTRPGFAKELSDAIAQAQSEIVKS